MTDMRLSCAACKKNFIPNTDSLWGLDIVECEHCGASLKVMSTETYDSETNIETVDFYTNVVAEV